MKRMIIVIALVSSLAACARLSDASVPKTDVPYVSTTGSTVKKGFELVFSSYRQGNTVVYYPQIDGLEDADRQDKLNEAIFEDAKKVIAFLGDDLVCITVDYEVVTKTNSEIVIKYTGNGYTSSESDDAETVEYTSVISLAE